jgi:hypothetical protein
MRQAVVFADVAHDHAVFLKFSARKSREGTIVLVMVRVHGVMDKHAQVGLCLRHRRRRLSQSVQSSSSLEEDFLPQIGSDLHGFFNNLRGGVGESWVPAAGQSWPNMQTHTLLGLVSIFFESSRSREREQEVRCVE